MKKILKITGCIITVCLLLSQLCACSSLIFVDQLSDEIDSLKSSMKADMQNTTTANVTTTTTKKTSKKVVTQPKATGEEEEEEIIVTTIQYTEETEYQEEEEYQLTQVEINQIRQRITREYQNEFKSYEQQYEQKRNNLKKQQGELAVEKAFALTQLRDQMAASGMLNSGQYKVRAAAIESSYNQKIQQIGDEISRLDSEYNSKKNGLQEAINQAVQDEIDQIQYGY